MNWSDPESGRRPLGGRRRRAAAQGVVHHLLEWPIKLPRLLSQSVGYVIV